jgi:ABC-type uncharacterized transport system fused permease/ATPase subunit
MPVREVMALPDRSAPRGAILHHDGTELPDTIVVSIGHHGTVEQHHQRHLELLGNGAWRLGTVTSMQ